DGVGSRSYDLISDLDLCVLSAAYDRVERGCGKPVAGRKRPGGKRERETVGDAYRASCRVTRRHGNGPAFARVGAVRDGDLAAAHSSAGGHGELVTLRHATRVR